MFNRLTERFNGLMKRLRGQGRLTEENIQEALQEVRTALLEADVALSVVTSFVTQVKEKALGQTVIDSINPGQAFIKIVHDELTAVMGTVNEELNLQTQPPAVILMAGLQGSGKTTTAAKLAAWLKQVKNKSVMLVSCDIYRPAAIEQLATLAAQVDISFFPSSASQSPVAIAQAALQHAKQQCADVLIIDTAGRLHIDDEMMREIRQIYQAVTPIETLFVVDSMTGQDAANTAKAFHDALPLTGIILTKTDGDARGGAALSARQITGKPIKFIGIGEKIDALEAFYPDRIASRLLDMGDILGLVEEAERKLDKKKTEALTQKFKKGKGFDLEDFLVQIEQMQNMGGVMGLLSKMPGIMKIPEEAKNKLNDASFLQMKAIIQSMTPKERRFPDLITGSRKQRIAKGSGTKIPDVNRVLKRYEQAKTLMKKMAKPGLLKHLMGKLPTGSGFPPF